MLKMLKRNQRALHHHAELLVGYGNPGCVSGKTLNSGVLGCPDLRSARRFRVAIRNKLIRMSKPIISRRGD